MSLPSSVAKRLYGRFAVRMPVQCGQRGFQMDLPTYYRPLRSLDEGDVVKK